MTCIVALKDGENIILGADRCIGGRKLFKPKIFKKRIEVVGVNNKDINVYIGLTGRGFLANYIEDGFIMPTYNKSKNKTFYSYLYNEFIPKLKKSFEKLGYSKQDDNQNNLDGSFLLIYDGIFYKINNILGLEDYGDNNYITLVSGSYHAEGSLYSTKYRHDIPEERVRLAIEAAAHHLSSVDDNIDIKIIKPTDYQC